MYTLTLCRILNLPPETERLAIRYALCHDQEEIFTSDIPGPAKRVLVKEEGYTGYIIPHVKEVIPDFWHKSDVPELVQQIVKVASLLDEVFYLATEQQLGNASLSLPMANSRKRLFEALTQLCVDAESPNMAEICDMVSSAIDSHRYQDSRILMG